MLYLKCLTNINIATIARRPSDSLVGSGLAVLLVDQFLGCFGYLCVKPLDTFGFLFLLTEGWLARDKDCFLPFEAVDPVVASLHVVPGGGLDVAFGWVATGGTVVVARMEGAHEAVGPTVVRDSGVL
jgi:hypothetical protein